MYVEVSAKRPVARRDKACAAAQAGGLGKARNTVSARHRTLSGGLAASGTQRAPRGLPWHRQAGAAQHPLRTAGGQRISPQRA
ncbi:Glyoxalase/bleomycin resistance protein/dioxygenase (fragment) [Xanthomonas citri pv. fuscans]